MRLAHDLHLAYCTNIHAAESWPETLAALERFVIRVRRAVCPPDVPYAIGLRLSARAAAELHGHALDDFRRWLDRHCCYVFTINGFPYGNFHGARVKDQVYTPDWRHPERLDYTRRLFDILAAILPPGVGGSVSTVPAAFKDAVRGTDGVDAMISQFRACAEFLARLSDRSGHDLHLAIEPEPLCLIETTTEAVDFFGRLHDGLAGTQRDWIRRHLGINYDTCHLAVEFENARDALSRLSDAGIRLGKLHLSSALRLPDPARHADCLAPFVEPTYLHQVVIARRGRVLRRVADLDLALAARAEPAFDTGDEWRVHFHVPLHAAPEPPILDTRDHLADALAWLAERPGACRHLEMETYTWSVLPRNMRSADVVDQLTREYAWTRDQLEHLGLAGEGR